MQIQFHDFNNADKLFASTFATTWAELEAVLSGMPLHLKESDQEGKQGTLIFDPVGTNAHIKEGLQGYKWHTNVAMPAAYDFLGTDVDFVKSGVLGEAQFSNYPFLLNNTVRSELLYKSKSLMAGEPIESAIIITKARMFPASNSTLYYEQAVNQLSELERNRVFDVPVRLVGLFEKQGNVSAVYTAYDAKRYSRTVSQRETRKVIVGAGRTADARCIIKSVGT